MPDFTIHPASYKDPAGFVFESAGIFYRQVNRTYQETYQQLMQSGLYKILVQKELLIPHTEKEENLTGDEKAWLILQPAQIPLISYPVEWCFDALKEAALLTLQVMELALEKGMILKDATAFNIQFIRGRAQLIDTLSFECYAEQKPWIAYRQFCESFLFPLLLGNYSGLHFQALLQGYPEGIPVDVAARLLPLKSRFRPAVWMHVYLQNRVHRAATANARYAGSFSKTKLLNLVQHLATTIQSLEQKGSTNWSNYYTETILGEHYLQEKSKIVNNFLHQSKKGQLLDIGANDGHFSLLAAKMGFQVIAVDSDPVCINHLYQKAKRDHCDNLLPLCLDITNPTPASGFQNRERRSFLQRVQPDLVMALALLHHLCIVKNLSFTQLASFFAGLAPELIIEFVPKEDEKTRQLLTRKEDIFPDYTQEQFESAFLQFFSIPEKQKIPGTERIIYRMKRNP
ncbi:MAG: SAM-dependent methyltransferase [Terrimonas sp.]|nr:SAM-dependent methyltransferase [Terrimonas sp.]